MNGQTETGEVMVWLDVSGLGFLRPDAGAIDCLSMGAVEGGAYMSVGEGVQLFESRATDCGPMLRVRMGAR